MIKKRKEKNVNYQSIAALVTCCTHQLSYTHLCTGSGPGVPVVLSPLGCASWRWDWTDERLWCEHHVQGLLQLQQGHRGGCVV